MMVKARNLKRGLMASGVALVLAVIPGPAAANPAACDSGVCQPETCDRICKAIGAYGGFCTADGGCQCWLTD